MKKEPFLLGAIAGIGILYILKKISPKKRSKKRTTKIQKRQGDTN